MQWQDMREKRDIPVTPIFIYIYFFGSHQLSILFVALYVSILVSRFIPPSFPPLVSIRLFAMFCLYFCFANRFICTSSFFFLTPKELEKMYQMVSYSESLRVLFKTLTIQQTHISSPTPCGILCPTLGFCLPLLFFLPPSFLLSPPNLSWKMHSVCK